MIEWTFNSGELPLNVHGYGISDLKIDKVKFYNGGVYACTGYETKYIIVVSTSTLIVYGKYQLHQFHKCPMI